MQYRIALRALALCAPALVFGALPQASAQNGDGDQEETIRYTIQQGDTCYGIAQRFFGNPRQCHEVIYRYNPQMGTDASNIRPGVTITIPVRTRNAPDARVTRTRREVQARASGSADWRQARRGLGLYRGWHVSTEPAASAEVTFRDESQIQMRENTLVIIYGGSSTNTARRRTGQATLERGSLRSRLGDLRLQVDTPSGETQLNGGSSVVSVDEEGGSVVSNHSGGSARVRGASGAPVTVRPGYGSTVARGERPARPRPLPAAPTLSEATPRAFVGIVRAGGTLRGEWDEVPDARYYRVEISTEEDGSGLIAAVQAPANVRRFEVHRLPAGTYYVRLATIDSHRLESRPSARVPLTMALVGLHSPGADEPDTDSVAEGDWGRPAETPQVLRGAEFVSPEGFQCSLSDATPAPRGALERHGRAEITCVDAEGRAQPALAVLVEEPTLTLQGAAPGVSPALTRHQPQEVRVQLEAEQELPATLRFSAPEGVEVSETRREGDELIASVTATEDAPESFDLRVVSVAASGDETELSSLPMSVQEPEPEAPVEAPAPLDTPSVLPPQRPQEAMGLALHPDVLGLINDRRIGSGGFVTLSHQGRVGQSEGYWRVSAGIEGSPTESLRIGLAHSIDVAEDGVVPAQRGDRDLLAWVGYRLIGQRDVSLYGEVAAWFPTGGAREGIDVVRFAPSLSLSYRLKERFLLRTRQGALLGAGSDGPFLWASAYGGDVQLTDWFYAGVEVDLSLGSQESDLFVGLGAGVGVSALVGPVTFNVGFRYGITDDFQQSVGRYTLSAGARVALH